MLLRLHAFPSPTTERNYFYFEVWRSLNQIRDTVREGASERRRARMYQIFKYILSGNNARPPPRDRKSRVECMIGSWREKTCAAGYSKHEHARTHTGRIISRGQGPRLHSVARACLFKIDKCGYVFSRQRHNTAAQISMVLYTRI